MGNINKSSKWFRISVIITVIALVTCFLFSSTLAKYSSSYYGEDNARIGSFSFGANGLGMESVNIDLFATIFDDEVLDTDGVNKDASGIKLISPGTHGFFDIELTGNAETDTEILYNFSDGTTIEDYETTVDIFNNENYQSSSTDFLPIIYSVTIDGVEKYYSNFFSLYTAAAHAFLDNGMETFGSEQAFRNYYINENLSFFNSLSQLSEQQLNALSITYGIDLYELSSDCNLISTFDLAKLSYVRENTVNGTPDCVTSSYDIAACSVIPPEEDTSKTIEIDGSLWEMGEDLTRTVEPGASYEDYNTTVNWFWAFEAVPTKSYNNGSLVWNGQNDMKDTYWASSGMDITSDFTITVITTQLD